jgi:creatinine amidohydrolase/Fe(II)-dependent formamide hydrolase-like protein
MTETGAFGGAQLATRDKGRAFIEKCLSSLSEIIDEIRKDAGED